jgi:glycosidase
LVNNTGDEKLRELIERAHGLGIKVILDLIPHLNRKSTEVPEDFAVQCVDGTGNLVVRASTGGWYGSWNDAMAGASDPIP